MSDTITNDQARQLYCPYSMSSPAGPRYCTGADCLGWPVCATLSPGIIARYNPGF